MKFNMLNSALVFQNTLLKYHTSLITKIYNTVALLVYLFSYFKPIRKRDFANVIIIVMEVVYLYFM